MAGHSIPGSRACLYSRQTLITSLLSLTKTEEARQIRPCCPYVRGPRRKYASFTHVFHCAISAPILINVTVNSLRHNQSLYPPPTPLCREIFCLQTHCSHRRTQHPANSRGSLHSLVPVRQHPRNLRCQPSFYCMDYRLRVEFPREQAIRVTEG